MADNTPEPTLSEREQVILSALKLREVYDNDQHMLRKNRSRRHNRQMLGWGFLVLGFALLILVGASRLILVSFWSNYVQETIEGDMMGIKEQLGVLSGKKEEVEALTKAYETLETATRRVENIKQPIEQMQALQGALNGLASDLNRLNIQTKSFDGDLPEELVLEFDYPEVITGKIFVWGGTPEPTLPAEIDTLNNLVNGLLELIASEKETKKATLTRENVGRLAGPLNRIAEKLTITDTANVSSRIDAINKTQNEVSKSLEQVTAANAEVSKRLQTLVGDATIDDANLSAYIETIISTIKGVKTEADQAEKMANSAKLAIEQALPNLEDLFDAEGGANAEGAALVERIETVLDELDKGTKTLAESAGDGFETIYLGGLALAGLLMTFGVTSLWSASKQLDEAKMDGDAVMNAFLFGEYLKMFAKNGLHNDETTTALIKLLHRNAGKEASDGPSMPFAQMIQQLDGVRKSATNSK